MSVILNMWGEDHALQFVKQNYFIGGVYMFYSTDCNYIVKIIGKDSHIECYTKEQLKNNIRHENGCIVYKVLNDGQLEKMAVIKPCK